MNAIGREPLLACRGDILTPVIRIMEQQEHSTALQGISNACTVTLVAIPEAPNGLADNAARVANPRRFLLIRHFFLALYLAVSTESGASKDAGSCEHQAYTRHQLRDAI